MQVLRGNIWGGTSCFRHRLTRGFSGPAPLPSPVSRKPLGGYAPPAQKGRAYMIALLLILAGSPSTPAAAQLTGSRSNAKVAALEAQIVQLKADLASCRGEAQPGGNQARAEAIASLRAVRSALNGGANLDSFRKYQIESRIKIDSIPDTPKNQPIREISDLYADALAFGITRITGSISELELSHARTKYADDEQMMKALQGMKAGDPGYVHDLNQLSAEFASRLLMRLAETAHGAQAVAS